MRQRKFLAAAAALFISLGSPSSEALSKGTFYLELKTGCYSANKVPTKPSKWTDTNYKTLYSTSCTSPHHYEVFFTGKIKATLIDSRDLFANAFKVVTERNTVYLMGRVTQREADSATALIRNVGGVNKVVRMFEIISEEELRRQLPAPAEKADADKAKK